MYTLGVGWLEQALQSHLHMLTMIPRLQTFGELSGLDATRFRPDLVLAPYRPHCFILLARDDPIDPLLAGSCEVYIFHI